MQGRSRVVIVRLCESPKEPFFILGISSALFMAQNDDDHDEDDDASRAFAWVDF